MEGAWAITFWQGYSRLFFPLNLQRRKKAMATREHGKSLRGHDEVRGGQRFFEERTVFDAIIFWQILEIARLHSWQIFNA